MSATRANFLGAASALIAVAGAGGVRLAVAQSVPSPGPGMLGTWIRIMSDSTVEMYTGKVEIGMGTTTGLMQIVAEELDVDFNRVRLIMGDTARTPDQGGVGGSTSTEVGAKPLRNAAAEARRALVAAAAQQFGVPAAGLSVTDGVVRDPASGRSVAYGALVASFPLTENLKTTGEATTVNVTGAATPKDPSAYRVVGQPIARWDIPDKVYGRSQYVGDVKVPGMMHGRVVRPPHAGATLVAVDKASIAGIGDAHVVVKRDFVAVVASKEWDAVRAAKALKVTWSAPQAVYPAPAELEGYLWSAPLESRHVTVQKGDLNDLDADMHALEAQYFYPFQSHATMGPGCGVADV